MTLVSTVVIALAIAFLVVATVAALVSIATIGSRRRAALTESLSLISSFSRTSSSARARSHSARETIAGMASAVPIP